MRRLFSQRGRHRAFSPPELKDPERESLRFRRRLLIAGALMITAFGGLFGRFFYLQVIQHGHYQTLADSNRVAIVPIAPNRGVITDRNGVVLAQSYSAYTLEIMPSRVTNLDATIDQLAKIVEVQPRDRKRFKRLLEESKRLESVPSAHAPDRRGSCALRGQSIPVPRRRHQGAAVPAISVRRDRFPADRLREPHQRPRPRAHRRMERDRELQGLRLHRQGRRRIVVRARAARRHRRRGSRGRFQRPRRAHAVAHAAGIRQQPATRTGHQSAENRRGGVRQPARGAGRDRSGNRRDPRLRLAARLRSEPVRRRHRSVGLGAVERFARQAAAQPAVARRVPAGIDDQAVSRAGRADLGQAHGDADDFRSRVLPDRRQHPPLPRRQARRPRLCRHDQVDRRVVRYLLLHAGRRDRHRRHLRVHVAVRIRPEDRHRSRGRAARRAAVAGMEARALLRRQLPRGASQMVSGRFDLGRASARDTTPSRRCSRPQAMAILANDGVAMRPHVVKAIENTRTGALRELPCGADAHARRQAAGSCFHQEGADRRAARRHQRGGIRRQPSTYPRARPAPRRSIRSRASATRRASTSACAIMRGTRPTRRPTSRRSRWPCWSRTADSARRRRRRSRGSCSTTTCSGRSRVRLPAAARPSRRASPTTSPTDGEARRIARQGLAADRAPDRQLPDGRGAGDRRRRHDHAGIGVRPERRPPDQPGAVARLRAGADVGRSPTSRRNGWRASRCRCIWSPWRCWSRSPSAERWSTARGAG